MHKGNRLLVLLSRTSASWALTLLNHWHKEVGDWSPTRPHTWYKLLLIPKSRLGRNECRLLTIEYLLTKTWATRGYIGIRGATVGAIAIGRICENCACNLALLSSLRCASAT
ncbi:hypothetical protein HanXRQr2_Chr11g0495701 [Helianthus annuus]|uniref:Secreted protein n=1 Tax=Helianthus annuus TaxID=4232 RepID=A0A9K3N0W1_HELAN|nr:hypothetical protein HanXRQr2_Chr11g0495701 [Helianthus annuus]